MGSLALRPSDSLIILEDGFVNRLQNRKFPHCPAIQATGLGLLPRWNFHPLFMPAFAGRTVFQDLEQLILAIGEYIGRHNQSPKPFIWTAKATDILEKVTRAQAALNKRLSV
jgi:hypothetical protein